MHVRNINITVNFVGNKAEYRENNFGHQNEYDRQYDRRTDRFSNPRLKFGVPQPSIAANCAEYMADINVGDVSEWRAAIAAFAKRDMSVYTFLRDEDGKCRFAIYACTAMSGNVKVDYWIVNNDGSLEIAKMARGLLQYTTAANAADVLDDNVLSMVYRYMYSSFAKYLDDECEEIDMVMRR